MGKHSCCISRRPPSPDETPARVAYRSPRKSIKKPPKNSLEKSPKSLYNLSPERSFKINRTSRHASSWGSKYSKPEDAAEIRAIFEDKEQTEQKDPVVYTKRSSGTLHAVKSKISKRLSRDSILSKRSGVVKRRSKLSIGTSEEEVERRRELRDIRKKRIREELSNAGIYDNDAKSFGSSLSLSELPEIRNDKVTLPTEEALFPLFEWTPSKLTGSAIFAISGRGTHIIQPHSPSPVRHQSTGGIYEFATSPRASSVRSRRHSFPITSPESALDLLLRGEFHEWDGQQPEMPPTPALEPMRLPSIVDLDVRRTSWRLSFASDNRACQLRAISQGSGPIPDVPGVDNLANPPAMKAWLRSQGLRSSSQALDRSDDIRRLESTRSHAELCSQDSEFGGVDGSDDGRIPVRLHEMQIHQRLASRGLASSVSTPHMSTWSSRYNVDILSVATTSVSHPPVSTRSRKFKSSSSSGISDLHIPGAWGATFRDGSSSSFYPTANASLIPTPESSQFNLGHLLKSAKPGGLSTPDTSSMSQKAVDPSMPNNTPANNVSLTSFQTPFQNSARHLTINCNSSLLESDTSSFRDRERALSLIKARFPDLNNPNRRLSEPHNSRFKEDFATSEDTGKSSFLSVLSFPKRRLDTSRSYDGNDSIDLSNALRRQSKSYGFSHPPEPSGPANAPNALSTRKPKLTTDISPSAVNIDTASAIWERALQMRADERATRVVNNLMVPDRGRKREGSHQRRSLSWRLKSKKRPLGTDETAYPAAEFQESIELGPVFPESIQDKGKSRADDISTILWAKELSVRQAQATENTNAARAMSTVHSFRGRGRPIVRRLSPEMWARFPSHTRSDRTGSATESDNVRPRDFAVSSISSKGSISYHTQERKHLHHHHPDKDHSTKHRSLPTRIGIATRKRFYKLRTSKTHVLDEARGRKSSTSVGGELEYPELEIVRAPLDWEEDTRPNLHNLEREVANMLIREERERRRVRTVSFDGSADASADDKDEVSIQGVDISDPKFYEDCLELQGLATDEQLSDQANSMDEKEKFRTWHGKRSGWEGLLPEMERLRSRSAEILRGSTMDFAAELKVEENMERNRVLRALEELN